MRRFRPNPWGAPSGKGPVASGGGGGLVESARYWRLYLGTSRNSNYPGWAEIEWYSGASTQEDLATLHSGGGITENLDLQTGTVARSFDGVTAGGTSTAGTILDMDSGGVDFNAWYDIDFGSATDFHHLRVHSMTDGIPEQSASCFALASSDDGITYTLLSAWAFDPITGGAWQTLNAPSVAGISDSDSTYDYLGLLMLEANGVSRMPAKNYRVDNITFFESSSEVLGPTASATSTFGVGNSTFNAVGAFNAPTSGWWDSRPLGRSGINHIGFVVGTRATAINKPDEVQITAETNLPNQCPTRFYPIGGILDGSSVYTMCRIGAEQSTTAFSADETKSFSF